MVRIDEQPPTTAKIEARIRRGKKWHKQLEDPNTDIANDVERMADVNHYLDSIKPAEKPKEVVKPKEKK